jgi:outer membrane protein TolC
VTGRFPARLVGLVIPLALSPARAAPQPRTVTLAEAVRLAAQVDPNVVDAHGRVRTTGAGMRAAAGGYLPTISTGTSYGRSFSEGPSRIDPITNQVLPGDISTGSLSLGANASYTIFDGLRRESQLRSTRAQGRAADAGLDYQRAQSALRATQSFLAAAQSTALVRIAGESIRRAEDQLRIAVARLSTRAATVVDSLQASADLGQARLSLLSREAQRAREETSLARTIGVDGRVTAAPDSALDRLVTVADTAALLAEALARSPRVLQAEANVDGQRAQVSSAKSGYLPSLALNAGTSFNGSNQNNYQLFNNRSVSLNVSWPLFNGFRRELDVAQQQASLETERARAEDARREVAAQLRAQLAALEAARQRIGLSQDILSATRAKLQVQLELYRIGSVDITRVTLAQRDLDQAEVDAVLARFDYVRAKAEIEAIIGRTL